MKEIARPCCGSCINFIVEYDYDNGYEIKCENTLISTPRNFCENYKPYNPIKNYEDDLLRDLIYMIKETINTLDVEWSWCDKIIQDIEKAFNKKWKDILNEISK